jgi:hypothetical protein
MHLDYTGLPICYFIISSSSSSSGSGAYALEHMPRIRRSQQGLLFNPNSLSVLDIPTSAARRLHVHTTREILAAKGGNVGENVGRNFA